jgi:hypothetical protein
MSQWLFVWVAWLAGTFVLVATSNRVDSAEAACKCPFPERVSASAVVWARLTTVLPRPHPFLAAFVGSERTFTERTLCMTNCNPASFAVRLRTSSVSRLGQRSTWPNPRDWRISHRAGALGCALTRVPYSWLSRHSHTAGRCCLAPEGSCLARARTGQ